MSTVQSVERAFTILEYVSAGASGVTEIAGQAQLPKSTVARLLATLESLGAIARVGDSSEYRLGPRLAELVGPVDATVQLIAAVRPHLERLALQLGEGTGFAVPSGSTVQVASQVDGEHAVQVRDYSGEMFPAHVGAPGVCMMAEWSDADLDRYLARPLAGYTEHTVVHPQQIRERIALVRRDGSCWAHEEFALGISTVAAVVRGPKGRALGSLYAHGPTYRFPGQGDADWIAEQIRRTAQQVFAPPVDGGWH